MFNNIVNLKLLVYMCIFIKIDMHIIMIMNIHDFWHGWHVLEVSLASIHMIFDFEDWDISLNAQICIIR